MSDFAKGTTVHANDCISRQAAINALTEYGNGRAVFISVGEAVRRIEQLPSAQPYTIHSDGRLWVTVDDIDKVNAVVVDEHKSKFCKQFYMDAHTEPKRGKWIHISEEMWKCDQCGEISCCSPNFCPDCGCSMEESNEWN